jgi:hypothetical protein
MPIFTYDPPVTVLAIISSTGATTGGITVSIIGTEFDFGATVTIGGNSATSVVVVDINHITAVTPAHAAGVVDVVVTNPDTTTGTLTNGYTYAVVAPTVTAIDLNYGAAAGGESVLITGTGFVATPTVLFGGTGATSVVFVDSNHLTCVTPAHAQAVVDITVTNPDTQIGVLFNGFTYTTASPFTDTKGWWYSDEGFGGGTQLALSPNVPKHPRHWTQIAGFAAGNAAMFGGFPASSVVFRNHIIYAGDDYTLGTDQPTIRIFDGLADRLMARIPNTAAAAIPKAIMSMLLIDGIIYLTTYDSGTTSADYAGRVFAFDPLSTTLTQLGSGFSGGELPYALAWHMNRLWLGTNKGDGSAAKIYYFRPNIDTVWTQDYTLATSTVGGACSLCSYKGRLFVGTDNAAGSFSKILVRSAAGAYSTSDTGAGGTARVNNAFLHMIVFGDNLYATYYNPDTTAVAYIRKFDNTSWSTVYTGSALTLRPYIIQFQGKDSLYVVGGGDSLRASLIRSTNGTTWVNLTAYLSGPITETALPAFGVVSL